MTRVWQGSLVVALLVFVTVAVGGRGAAQDNEFAAQSEFIDPDATLKNARWGRLCVQKRPGAERSHPSYGNLRVHLSPTPHGGELRRHACR